MKYRAPTNKSRLCARRKSRRSICHPPSCHHEIYRRRYGGQIYARLIFRLTTASTSALPTIGDKKYLVWHFSAGQCPASYKPPPAHAVALTARALGRPLFRRAQRSIAYTRGIHDLRRHWPSLRMRFSAIPRRPTFKRSTSKAGYWAEQRNRRR